VGPFKAYDIRGVYGKDFDRGTVYAVGRHLPGLLEADRVLVGYDCRKSSPEIFEALTEGILDAGADVEDMGPATTPMVYYVTATGNFPASVQITASHNPGEYNGMKISRKGALPVGYDTGLRRLEEMVRKGTPSPAASRGKLRRLTGAREDYLSFLAGFLGDLSPLRVAVDCSNGMASLLAADLFGRNVTYIYDTMDGNFPNHDPNPLVEKNTADLKELVLKEGMDVGAIFDGDGDRVVFVDENGGFVRPDIMTAVLGESLLEKNGEWVLHDVRTSRGVIERIRNLGGKPYMWKVGHSHAKMKMRELGAAYGGELAGHYYFRHFFNCDSGMLAAIHVLNILAARAEAGRSFSELVEEIDVYSNSGEVNFIVSDKAAAMNAVVRHFSSREIPSNVYDFDGYRLEFREWWFSLRPSNTEPYLRLVAEASSPGLLEEKLREIRTILDDFRED